MALDVQPILAECRTSGDRAYAVFKGLLEELHHPETRANARRVLAALERHTHQELNDANCLGTYHFRIHELVLSDYEGFSQNRQKLTLLELPSIFIPEDWSFTFFEGINRLPDVGFQGRDVAELGCGNGWVSIAIAEKWSPRKVYGLDINPRAIKVAWINLYLNALDNEGSLVMDHEGKSLLDRVEFHVSDLLSHCREHKIMLDRIVGCIPQVLSPDPEAMLKIVSENASEEFLYSLSNYCGLQGFVEDQFGLGLIARAAEEGIGVIRPTGTMIFNIGGRPGQAVCERLFKRRGFQITKLWQTRVNQAADTDILALVEIEKTSRHRFEFFMGLHCEEPISARTAWAYSKAGGQISHGLSVYQCLMEHPNEIKTIFKFLSKGSLEARGALDLAFDDQSVSEEKIPFLAHLATSLEGRSTFPYELPAGSLRFRKLIAGFLRIYHNIPLAAENVVVLPSRPVLIENILHLFHPNLALIESSLTRWLPKKWLTVLPNEEALTSEQDGYVPSSSVAVIEAPHSADLLIQLIKKLRPQVVITSLADFEMRTSTAFDQLLNECASVNARLFLDISDHIEFSSTPGTNGVLQYLAAHPLPLHATIICGLVKNKVYSDLEVAFMLSENKDMLHAMALTGSLMNGRTAVVSQFYYGCLLHELLSFQLPDRHITAQRKPQKEIKSSLIKFAEGAQTAMAEAELSSTCSKSSIIHMDFDINELPVPLEVKLLVFEGFARQNISDMEMDPTAEILEFVNTKFGLGSDFCTEVVLSDSYISLFTKIIRPCKEENGTLFFPMGCSGTYVSAAKFLDVKVKQIPTRAENSYKVTPAEIHQFIEGVQNPWLYISGPTVNPTGMLYTAEDISNLLSICKDYGVRVIIDATLSGLEYNSHSQLNWNLQKAVGIFALVGGFSTELMTGGLEFGFAAFNSSIFLEAFKDAPSLSKPHCTLKYAIKKLLSMQKSSVLQDGLKGQQTILRKRVEQMRKVLSECGWEIIVPLGGVSLLARPVAYEGKAVSYDDAAGLTRTVSLNSENIKHAIYSITGLCISSSAWTGIPNHCRFAIAVEEEKYQVALESLQTFKTFVLG